MNFTLDQLIDSLELQVDYTEYRQVIRKLEANDYFDYGSGYPDTEDVKEIISKTIECGFENVSGRRINLNRS